jgi:hypothetical protein
MMLLRPRTGIFFLESIAPSQPVRRKLSQDHYGVIVATQDVCKTPHWCSISAETYIKRSATGWHDSCRHKSQWIENPRRDNKSTYPQSMLEVE